MKNYFYDPVTHGFYNNEVNFEIPETAIEITKSKYDELQGVSIEVVDGIPQRKLPAPISKEKKFCMLWEACTNYRKERISEEGLIYLNEHKNFSKTKAVYDWVQSLWDEYYRQRAMIEQGQDPSYDFSDIGEMPYTFIECREEINQ